ncbi:MAG: hypothetical protein IT462_06740 [Planctomycetes bacterium]|nr:hypothetical protein [Planctomycetota bacterium]
METAFVSEAPEGKGLVAAFTKKRKMGVGCLVLFIAGIVGFLYLASSTLVG